MAGLPQALAEQLALTPPQTEGPFYPDKLPLDTDNDLLRINEAEKLAVGDITYLSGRVLNPAGDPIRDAVVEIWQCDSTGVYLHSGTGGDKAKRDAGFQGFGRHATGADGSYLFRTIKPVPYPGRPAPHIHVKVKKGDRELLTTQILVRGHEGNARDNIYNGVRDLIDRELILTDFVPLEESKVGELHARFDLVLGRTPDDRARESKRS